jgi:hypothetical protein
VDAKTTNNSAKLRKGDIMDISIAEMVLVSCKVDEQNHQYSNPTDETPCHCSGCMPEISAILPPAKATPKRTANILKAKHLTKAMRVLGTHKLTEF